LLAWQAYFRILFDSEWAARVQGLRSEEALPDPKRAKPALASEPTPESPSPPVADAPSELPALQLLAILQREARFVDFVKQDIEGFADAQIGQAARLVHDGCAKVVARHFEVTPVLDAVEGAAITVPKDFSASAIKLTGNVSGSAPYRGTLNHAGWRATKSELPEPVSDHDFMVLAPAEVEVAGN
jgi:hypothetical protein